MAHMQSPPAKIAPEHQSLSDLRRRTDWQLVVLARLEINLSLSLARGGSLAEAEAKLTEAGTFIGVARTSLRQRRKLEGLLVSARQNIASSKTLPPIIAHPACR